jgi:hypothetical protein
VLIDVTSSSSISSSSTNPTLISSGILENGNQSLVSKSGAVCRVDGTFIDKSENWVVTTNTPPTPGCTGAGHGDNRSGSAAVSGSGDLAVNFVRTLTDDQSCTTPGVDTQTKTRNAVEQDNVTVNVLDDSGSASTSFTDKDTYTTISFIPGVPGGTSTFTSSSGGAGSWSSQQGAAPYAGLVNITRRMVTIAAGAALPAICQ